MVVIFNASGVALQGHAVPMSEFIEALLTARPCQVDAYGPMCIAEFTRDDDGVLRRLIEVALRTPQAAFKWYATAYHFQDGSLIFLAARTLGTETSVLAIRVDRPRSDTIVVGLPLHAQGDPGRN